MTYQICEAARVGSTTCQPLRWRRSSTPHITIRPTVHWSPYAPPPAHWSPYAPPPVPYPHQLLSFADLNTYVMEKSSARLIHFDKATPALANEIKEALESNDVDAKIDAMKKAILIQPVPSPHQQIPPPGTAALGIGEPNLSGKPNLEYDQICKPHVLHRLKKTPVDHQIENHEIQTPYATHQILESWIFVAKMVVERVSALKEDLKKTECRESKWTNRWGPNVKDEDVLPEKPRDCGRFSDVNYYMSLPTQSIHRDLPAFELLHGLHLQFEFIAGERLEDSLVLLVEDRTCKEPMHLGHLIIPVGSIDQRIDETPVAAKWYPIECRTGGGGNKAGGESHESHYAGRIHLRMCLEGRYHVLDEAAQASNDFRPTAKQLWNVPVGILELGILCARGLLPMKSKCPGKGSTDAYCVTKYGTKWVQTRTITDSFDPRWNEQYTWQVYDLCTVLTLAVLDQPGIQPRGRVSFGCGK